MARGSIVKRPTGSYGIRYWDHTGKRHYETVGANRGDAERMLNTRLHELQAGTWRCEATSETLASYTERWLERRDPTDTPAGREGRLGRGRLAPSTHREYQRSLELHVLPRLGHRPLLSIRPLDVDELIATLEKQGRAAGTIRNAIVPLRKMLGDAVRQDLIPSNPASRPDLPPAEEFIGKAIPIEDTDAIRQALQALAGPDLFRPGENDLLYVHLFDLALGTALRLGELRALRWCDIHRDQHLIRVEQAYSRQQLKRPKSAAGIRSIPIFPSTHAALNKLAARALERGRYAPDNLILTSDKGTPLQPSNLNRRIWQPALREAGLVDGAGKTIYRFHDLRHTAISRLVAAGADIKLVQTLAGHSNPTITLQRYTHLLDARLTEAAGQFDPAAQRADSNSP